MSKLYIRNQLCIPVSGYNRAIIYDIGRKDYHFISNEQCRILNTDGFINFEKITNQNERDELIEHLLALEIIFEVATPQEEKRFPKISRKLHTPDGVTHAVLHANISPKFIEFISNQYLQNLSIIAPEINSELLSLIDSFSKLEIDGIYLYIESCDDASFEKACKELGWRQIVFSVNFFGCDAPSTKLEDNIYYNFFTVNLADYQQMITIDKLFVNQDLFLEAYNKHSYYNGKIYIDRDGNIKNGLNNVQSFGNINTIDRSRFLKTISSDTFLELGNIKKSETLVCKHCEFRYMCTDARVPLKGSGHWYHQTDCQYNPYLSKWQHDENYFSLAASGVSVSETGCTIDKKKLTKMFNQIWGE